MGSTSEPAAVADDGWPSDKFLRGLKAWQAQSGRRPCALVSTGAMNPIHRGHVELLERAKRELESQGFFVLGGWLSASHDGYVKPKMMHLKARCLPDELRVELVRRSVESSHWMAAGAWEALGGHPHWPDFPEVAEELRRHLCEKHTELPEDFLVFYVCGLDHYERCRLDRGIGIKRGLGVVVVPREGREAGKVDQTAGVYAASQATATAESSAVELLSSTKLRAATARSPRSEAELDDIKTAIYSMMVPSAAKLLITTLLER